MTQKKQQKDPEVSSTSRKNCKNKNRKKRWVRLVTTWLEVSRVDIVSPKLHFELYNNTANLCASIPRTSDGTASKTAFSQSTSILSATSSPQQVQMRKSLWKRSARAPRDALKSGRSSMTEDHFTRTTKTYASCMGWARPIKTRMLWGTLPTAPTSLLVLMINPSLYGKSDKTVCQFQGPKRYIVGRESTPLWVILKTFSTCSGLKIPVSSSLPAWIKEFIYGASKKDIISKCSTSIRSLSRESLLTLDSNIYSPAATTVHLKSGNVSKLKNQKLSFIAKSQ